MCRVAFDCGLMLPSFPWLRRRRSVFFCCGATRSHPRDTLPSFFFYRVFTRESSSATKNSRTPSGQLGAVWNVFFFLTSSNFFFNIIIISCCLVFFLASASRRTKSWSPWWMAATRRPSIYSFLEFFAAFPTSFHVHQVRNLDRLAVPRRCQIN